MSGWRRHDGLDFTFDIDPVWKTKLVNGWDDIDLTAAHGAEIAAFAAERRARAPWVWETANRGRAPNTGRER
jgi:3-isopropylmalate/(R)-2-methylmalate dehydratase small subunit